jgi:hypothetical protein
MPFLFIFLNGRRPVRDLFVNNEHDQFDPELFFVCFKNTEFGGECVLSFLYFIFC